MSVGIVYIAEMSVKLCILTYFSGSKIKQNLALKPCENEAKHKLPHDRSDRNAIAMKELFVLHTR